MSTYMEPPEFDKDQITLDVLNNEDYIVSLGEGTVKGRYNIWNIMSDYVCPNIECEKEPEGRSMFSTLFTFMVRLTDIFSIFDID